MALWNNGVSITQPAIGIVNASNTVLIASLLIGGGEVRATHHPAFNGVVAGQPAVFFADTPSSVDVKGLPIDIVNASNTVLMASVSVLIVDQWYAGGPPLQDISDINVVTRVALTTYYMRGVDSLAGFVYWSSMTTPNTSPTSTTPTLVGELGGVCVIGSSIAEKVLQSRSC